MVQSSEQRMIDLKDLLYLLLKKCVRIFLCGFIFSCLFGGYKLYSYFKDRQIENNSNVSSILNVSERLPNESDEAYRNRVSRVNHAEDLINTINVLNNQIDNNRKYVSNSVFMSIDPENEAFTTVNLIIDIDKGQSDAVVALGSTYRQYILSGEYLLDVSEELGINQGYITELISASNESSSNTLILESESNNVGLISIMIIGPNNDFTDKIMNSVIENILIKNDEMNKTVVRHSISIASRQSSVKVDNTTRERQMNTIYRFETLQQQINNYEKSLDNISSDLGIDKVDIYRFYNSIDISSTQESSFSVKTIFKFLIIGFVFGVIVGLVIIILNYLFNRKFSTQGKFFAQLNNIYKIGVVKPNTKRNRFIKYIERKAGDDNSLSEEKALRILSANIKNLTFDMSNVIFTGTADYSQIKKLVDSLGVDADVKNNIFIEPDILDSIKSFDGIILVEQRNYSDLTLVFEEVRLFENSRVKILGAIII